MQILDSIIYIWQSEKKLEKKNIISQFCSRNHFQQQPRKLKINYAMYHFLNHSLFKYWYTIAVEHKIYIHIILFVCLFVGYRAGKNSVLITWKNLTNKSYLQVKFFPHPHLIESMETIPCSFTRDFAHEDMVTNKCVDK